MKKKFLITVFIVLLLSFTIYAEEDPFEGLDFGTPADNTAVTGTAGSENATQSAENSSEDIFSSIDAEISQTGEQILFPEDTTTASTSQNTSQTSEIDFLFSESAAATPTPAARMEKVEKQIVKKEQPKKWDIKTIISEPLTDFIYTKNGELGMQRKLDEHLKYNIKASSNLNGFTPNNINDNYADTAWIENGKNDGIGETLTFDFNEITFAPVYEKKYKSIEIKEIKILNGLCKDEETWEKYNRVKKIKILHNKQVKYHVNLHDSKNWQIVKLPVPIKITPGDEIKIVIEDVYPEIRNARITNTAISEILLIGGPTGPTVENKYIATYLLTE